MSASFTRRQAFFGTAALAATAALPAAAAPAKPAPAKLWPIKLGIATYTFRNFDVPHLLEFLKRLKITNANVKDMHLKMGPNADVAASAAVLRDAGLTLTGAGNITFFKNDPAAIRANFEYCKAAGIHTMICAPSKEVLPLLDPYVKEYDIRLAIHNHGPEDKFFPSPLDVLAAVKNLDPRIGCCIDVGHTMRAGTDVPTAIRAAGPRLFDVHMKDLADATSKESQVAVGEGIMPVREIFLALAEIKYPGFVDLEYEIEPKDPMPGVIESIAYMRGVLNGLGYPKQA